MQYLMYRLRKTRYSHAMPYEDPIEAALRALTGIEWRKRNGAFEARINKTHMNNLQEVLTEHRITVYGEVSAARSGRYIATVSDTQIPMILKAVESSGAKVKPHRRKWQS